jgi:hypothetical protein
MLNSDTAKMTRTSSGGGMSASADLAYRYGPYSSDRANVTERGYFLSIWKAERNGDWKIIVDLQKKTPTPSQLTSRHVSGVAVEAEEAFLQ